MANASVRWISGKRFIGIDSTNHSVVIIHSRRECWDEAQ